MTLRYEVITCTYKRGKSNVTVSMNDSARIDYEGIFLRIGGYKGSTFKEYRIPITDLCKLELTGLLD